MGLDNHYSAREVVELLGITFNNLHQLQHRGTLKWTQKIGQKVYYPEEVVNAYREKRLARRK
jgi:predicted site-specific integrase-resolvase